MTSSTGFARRSRQVGSASSLSVSIQPSSRAVAIRTRSLAGIRLSSESRYSKRPWRSSHSQFTVSRRPESWRGATFKRYFVEWQKRNTQGTHYLRFVSPHVYEPIGDDLGDVTIDLPLADVDPRWLDQVMARAQGTLTIIAAEPWARDMRAWQLFLRHCGPFGRTMLLTTCHAPGRSTQAKAPIVYGEPRPFMPRIWLPGTPEVIS